MTHAVALTLLVVAACGGSDDATPSAPSGAANVGPQGGTVVSADGRVILTIPSGALTSDVAIRITPTSAQDVPSDIRVPSVHPVYKLEPDGTRFAQPVKVEVRSPGAVTTEPDGSLNVPTRILFSSATAEGIEALPSAQDSKSPGAMRLTPDKVVIAEGLLTHFSWLSESDGALHYLLSKEHELPLSYPVNEYFSIYATGKVPVNRYVVVRPEGGAPVSSDGQTDEGEIPMGDRFATHFPFRCEDLGRGYYKVWTVIDVDVPEGTDMDKKVRNGREYAWSTTDPPEFLYILSEEGLPRDFNSFTIETECKYPDEMQVTCCSLETEACSATSFEACHEAHGVPMDTDSCTTICPAPRACCQVDGSCTLTRPGECAGEAYRDVRACGAPFFCPIACDGEPALTGELASVVRSLKAGDPDMSYLEQVICGLAGVTKHSNGVLEGQCEGYTCINATCPAELNCGQLYTDQLFNNSVFPCGPSATGFTVCPPAPSPVKGESFHILGAAVGAPIPLADPANRYQYAFVFDEDGDVTNNYQPAPAYPSDFFKDTDRWYEALYVPGTGWTLKASNAKNGSITPFPTNARIIIRDNAIVLVVPKSELAVPHPAYRITTFRHKGDYGINEPHDWDGDVEPPVAQGLTK